MKLSAENERMVKLICEVFEITLDQAIEQILTEYRARKRALEMLVRPDPIEAFPEFTKDNSGSLITGAFSFAYLLAKHRSALTA